jgi:IS605 OrfB family transposase
MVVFKKPPDKLWFPTLLQVSNNIDTNSWFNMLQKNNPNKQNLQKETIDSTYIKTMKFPIYPTKEQKIILDHWFHAVIDMYNITNKYILDYYKDNKKIETFITIRKILLDKANKLVEKTKINKHILDYSVKHCVEMYKSAISNLKSRNIKEFTIKDLDYNKNRYNMVLEPANFSKTKNGFCVRELGEMKSQRTLINFFKSNSILQYNKNSDKYYIISPFDKNINKVVEREDYCGIDLGVRTFATVYSPNNSLEIGTNLTSTIDKYNKKMDKIKSDKDLTILTEQKYKKILYKYGNKMRNKTDDLHKKVSVYLVNKYNNIHLGKISTSNVISNKRGNLKEIVKRRINVLSFYKFNETIKKMAIKYKSNVKDINEYMTSKKCHNCQNIHKELGANKVYKCEKCKIEIDRDINASINMYKIGLL